MEFCDGSSMQYMKRTTFDTFSIRDKLDVTSQVTPAMNKLHTFGVVHRYLLRNDDIKITDYCLDITIDRF